MTRVFSQSRKVIRRRIAVRRELSGHRQGIGVGNTLVTALRGVDLDVPFGEMTLLVGPSGCGKTTLLSVIAGILDPTRGEVHVLGVDVARLSSGRKVAFRGKNIGFVFQQYNLLPALTAAENVAVPLMIGGASRRVAVAKAQALLPKVGLAKRMHSLPAELSGGEQQRVAIARALIHEPSFLVCDEPTAALDAENGRNIMELMHEVAVSPTRAVVVVTHDNRVFSFGDRIATMEDGRIVSVEAKAGHEAVVSPAVASERGPESDA